MERDELADWLRLALTPGIGDGTARRLLAAFGLPGAVFTQSPAALRDVVTPAQAAALQRPPADLDAQHAKTWDWLQTVEPDGAVRRLLTLGDPGYPAALLETADPPPMLYLLGAAEFDLTQLARSVAIVGSRNPTPQGELNARAFARALGEADVVVVSGLALGVDGAAHQGALDAVEAAQRGPRLATVAVVGTGLDRVYPARHRALAHRIASNGLIVSEFALGTPPLHPNFPRRNRIIAGLARGTLVIEAALQSGSLITARLAVEQGREVFAIPGSIHSPQSRGCHALIRQGAKLVESVQDVLEELRFDSAATATSHADAEETPDHADLALLQAIGFDPVGLDALCARTGHGAATLQGLLLELELEGRVARLPGGLFQRVAQG
ncbi:MULTISPECIES: DNA-processing protein DprA [unclassified Variovorax]|uniref:DNA-processing protein DprA n=1 Tax=unclassified Variovorax TaxID=663243 RepID=UPI002577A385|nr:MULTISPECIES: DNA-processing protein DprA [unclassified Variovorax]MDM0091078.1 DNA-processing protein DprA [Variovorax sp. J22G40]MDM0148920.1 DNA-processing protein DprA [Variovorax sp. J2P1-31]